jgi:hypothetical protein
MRVGLLLVLVAALGVAASYAPPADVASRTVDRTFVCKPVAFGGIGDLDVLATPPGDLNFNRPTTSYLLLGSGGSEPDSNLVFVRARSQVHYAGLTNQTAYGGPGGVFAHAGRCAPARKRIGLSSRGLPGPPTLFERDLDRPVRGRVLARVRATFRAPTSWRTRAYGAYAGARQTVTGASLAVRSERTGIAIAYMELDQKGRTKLWYSGSCTS